MKSFDPAFRPLLFSRTHSPVELPTLPRNEDCSRRRFPWTSAVASVLRQVSKSPSSRPLARLLPPPRARVLRNSLPTHQTTRALGQRCLAAVHALGYFYASLCYCVGRRPRFVQGRTRHRRPVTAVGRARGQAEEGRVRFIVVAERHCVGTYVDSLDERKAEENSGAPEKIVAVRNIRIIKKTKTSAPVVPRE